MWLHVSDQLLDVVAFLEGEEVVKKYRKNPLIKPKRRRPSYKNKTQRSDYSKNYMRDYRTDGKDYQKVPDKIKDFRREQKKHLKETFGLQE